MKLALLLRHDREAKYCDVRVCLSVCVFVSARAYLRNNTPDQCVLPLCTCIRFLWPWLGPPLAALRYVMYTSGFTHDVMWSRMGNAQSRRVVKVTRSACNICPYFPRYFRHPRHSRADLYLELTHQGAARAGGKICYLRLSQGWKWELITHLLLLLDANFSTYFTCRCSQ